MKPSHIRTYLPWIVCVLGIIALTVFAVTRKEPADTVTQDAAAPAEIKFNLSEGERRSVWNEYVRVEDKAAADAKQQYPADGLSQTEGMAMLTKQANYSKELKKGGKAALAKKYGLSDEQLSQIVTEGIQKDWPLPILQ